jgi:outer membrane immunogenic protein
MKRILLSVIGISGLLIAAPLSIASAADMALKAPPPPPAPVFSWTGFYVGGQIGGAPGHDAGSIDNPGIPFPPAIFLPFTVNTSGGMGGFHAGYNYQVNQWVFGLEGSVDWTKLDKTFNFGVCPLFCATATTKADTQGSIRGRVGICSTPPAAPPSPPLKTLMTPRILAAASPAFRIRVMAGLPAPE